VTSTFIALLFPNGRSSRALLGSLVLRLAGQIQHRVPGLPAQPETECLKTSISGITHPPRIAPARGPPAWDDPPVSAAPDWDALAQPEPEYVFDQQVQW
jgi:hypothetical protein